MTDQEQYLGIIVDSSMKMSNTVCVAAVKQVNAMLGIIENKTGSMILPIVQVYGVTTFGILRTVHLCALILAFFYATMGLASHVLLGSYITF